MFRRGIRQNWGTETGSFEHTPYFYIYIDKLCFTADHPCDHYGDLLAAASAFLC